MNILHTETLYNWGGEQNKVMNEMGFMRELGHEVYLFCNPNSEILKAAKSENFNTIECEMNKKNFHKSIPALCKTIKENSINVVITHASTDSWVGAIAGLLWRKRGVKFLRERHNMFPIKGIVSKFMHKKMFDKIIAVSKDVQENLQNIGVENIFFMPTSINFNKLNSTTSDFKDEFGLSSQSITIGMFSNLYRKKGVFEFANAIKKIINNNDNIIAVFGGNINENTKNEILQIFDVNLHNKLIFTGFRKDNANIIKGIDIFAFPSHTEGMPNALLEAMALSRPIVAFDIPPMNELLANERGICVPFLDDEALANALNLYINDKNLRILHSSNASKFAKENYDITSLKNNIKILLESL
ncbi:MULTISPECIES: glycosyltransferase family 4 protein [Campylobacter]|uniref:Glycosyltransferase, family 1 n=1 Tax=Campylobacter curvus (strain 525.92) TaxID=360105 RepID=A7GWU6_CAMC5|nr:MULTISPECIES: glycosyltransferase family 4 protein [Campylobacter]EAU00907.1 glycosyltransferase, family 1 [Campylobacter curvus 525.92]EJP74651.1 glycosyltransferase, group 1 family protein [Campylobacter sp. FOBRC14]